MLTFIGLFVNSDIDGMEIFCLKKNLDYAIFVRVSLKEKYMGRKKRTEIHFKQKQKRKKRRQKLQKAKRDVKEFFSNGIYVGRPM